MSLNKLTPHVFEVSLDDAATQNELTKKMVWDLTRTLEEIDVDPDVRSVILRSAHPGYFARGMTPEGRRELGDLEGIFEHIRNLRILGKTLFSLKVPTVAMLEGEAVGTALELALTCDLRVATSSTLFAFPATGEGRIPLIYGTQLLSYIAGEARAKELLFTGKEINGVEAKRIGLVNEAVQPKTKEEGTGEVERVAREMAERISERGPIGQQMAKRAINNGFLQNLERGGGIEWESIAVVYGAGDRNIGLQALLEKKKPDFS